MIVLYVLFVLSIFFPVYTFALYPIILKLLKERQYKVEDINLSVSAIIIGSEEAGSVKRSDIEKCDNPPLEVILTQNVSDGANRAKGDIFLFTDTKTKLDSEAIKKIVKPFADKKVGAVVGQQTNPEGNSAFWKYENLVKSLESRIGCVSGANDSIFAVRRESIPSIAPEVKNALFYIATSITQQGRDIVYAPSAKAYEGKTEGVNFNKHVEDAAGYWQALRLFPKMLLPRKGSFVYISHRVMKWFVWLNMVVMLITSGVLAFSSLIMAILFALQLIGYVSLLVLGKNRGGLFGIGHYFLMLNFAYLIGVFWRNKP